MSVGKKFIPKPGSGQIPIEEQITLEPELEEALKNATDAEMCDIAGERRDKFVRNLSLYLSPSNNPSLTFA